jgi:hypothetical protein
MTDSAISIANSGGGLSVGIGPSVAVMDAGNARGVDHATVQSDIYAFIYGQYTVRRT